MFKKLGVEFMIGKNLNAKNINNGSNVEQNIDVSEGIFKFLIS